MSPPHHHPASAPRASQPHSIRWPLVGLLLLAGLTGHTGDLQAMPGPGGLAPDWAAQPYAYLVIDQDVRDVLKALGSNLGISVAVADAVKGKVRGKVRGDTAEGFLAAICAASGLSWYYDGTTLFVDNASGNVQRTFDTQALPADRVQQALSTLTGGGVRSRLQVDDVQHQVVASGPPGYLESIGRQLAALRPAPQPPARTRPTAAVASSVRIFRGSAQTQVVSGRD
jgi:type II secretory pathway component GspD/PulD (secretin)